MTYVITSECIGCKDMSCVAVCPVDCIHPLPDDPDFETAEQLYINPNDCIDCGACATACPVDAPLDETLLRADQLPSVALNAAYFA